MTINTTEFNLTEGAILSGKYKYIQNAKPETAISPRGNYSTQACRRDAKTANSLPTRVGDADWPCVRASMATSRHFQARSFKAAMRSV